MKKVTVIIPAPPDIEQVRAVEFSRNLDYPEELLEILLVRGRQPSVQRNLAIREAQGELVFFLDDDSMPMRDILQKGIKYFENDSVQIVGGPTACPEDASLLEKIFVWTMSSWIAFGPSRARYFAVGKVRKSSEKELILCNMLARKSALLDCGGFDESLYPNEENALMDEIQKKGGILMYDPELVVYRHPRKEVSAFLEMLMTYGRGRAEQFRSHPGMGSLPNLVPPMFCVFLCITPFLIHYVWPLWFIYLIVLLCQTALVGKGVGRVGVFPFLFLTHVCYGLGFWKGLFTRYTKKKTSTILPKIEVIKNS